MEQVQGALVEIINDDGTHARFLNSISYLEYRGARKIARALGTNDIDDSVLNHAMDEFKHALYFKKLAMRVGGSRFKGYTTETLLAPTAIKRYFHELDRGVERLMVEADLASIEAVVAKPGLQKSVYQMVTWLIEKRAIALYHEYEALLAAQNRHSISLKPIVQDEVGHLAEVGGGIEGEKKSRTEYESKMIALEAVLFRETWAEIEAALDSDDVQRSANA